MLIAGGMSIFIFIILFCIFAFGMGQVAWIYLDSKERGDKWSILWALFAVSPLLIPMMLPLPLVIYLLVTRAFSTKCSKCGEKVVNSFAACPACGNKLKEKCVNCGKLVKEEWNYCAYCNEKILKEIY